MPPRHFGRIPREVRREAGRSAWIDRGAIGDVIFFSVIAAIYVVVFVFAVVKGHAREAGQWEATDPQTRLWYKNLKQPDNKHQSCCGEADAYWADKVWVSPETGDVFAVITDERPDAPLSRPHIKPGTKILVPPNKNKDTSADPNPTGHTIIFVRWYAEGSGGNWGVLCYLPDGGV